MSAPLPKWLHMDFRCVVRQIQAGEVNEESFRSLQHVCTAARECLQSPDPMSSDFADQILEAVKLECELHFTKAMLREGCRRALLLALHFGRQNHTEVRGGADAWIYLLAAGLIIDSTKDCSQAQLLQMLILAVTPFGTRL